MRRINEDRNVLRFLLLTLATCGIYAIVDLCILVEDINEMLLSDGKRTMNFVLMLLLSALTCGIYLFVWCYALGERLRHATRERDLFSGITGFSLMRNWLIILFLLVAYPFITYFADEAIGILLGLAFIIVGTVCQWLFYSTLFGFTNSLACYHNSNYIDKTSGYYNPTTAEYSNNRSTGVGADRSTQRETDGRFDAFYASGASIPRNYVPATYRGSYQAQAADVRGGYDQNPYGEQPQNFGYANSQNYGETTQNKGWSAYGQGQQIYPQAYDPSQYKRMPETYQRQDLHRDQEHP